MVSLLIIPTDKKVFYFMLGPNNINVDTIYDIEIKFFNALVCNSKNLDDAKSTLLLL